MFEYNLDKNSIPYKYLESDTILVLERFIVDMPKPEIEKIKNIMIENGYYEKEIEINYNVIFKTITPHYLNITFNASIKNFHHTEKIQWNKNYFLSSINYTKILNEYGRRLKLMLTHDLNTYIKLKIKSK